MINSISLWDSYNMFEERLEILSRELELSEKWRRPAMLVVLYGSEEVRNEAASVLEQHILLKSGNRVIHMRLEDESAKGIFAILQEHQNTDEWVFFLEGFDNFTRENNVPLRFLDEYANFVNEKRIRTILWIAQDDAMNFAHQAPDFWTSCQRIVELDAPPNPEQAFLYAYDCAWQGAREGLDIFDNDEACNDWLTTQKQDLFSVETRANLLLSIGIHNWRKGDFEKSDNILQTALKVAVKLQNNQFEAECYNAIALVKSSLGQHEEAIDAYRQVIQLIPNQFTIWNHMGNLCLKTHRNDEAIIAFQKTIEHSPEDPIAWIGLGNVYSQIGYKNDAITAYQKAATFAPSLPQPWNGLGNVYMSDGKLEEAVQAYRKSIKLNQQSITPWLGLAQLFAKHDRGRDALKAYRQVLEINPKNSLIWNDLGQMYLRLDDYQDAANSFSKAIQLDQRFGFAYRNLAITYSYMGNYREAISVHIRSMELFSREDDQAQSWNYLGEAYRQLGEYDNAMTAYQMADKLLHGRIADQHPVPVNELQPNPAGAVDIKHEMDFLPVQTEEIYPAITEENGVQEELPDQPQSPNWVFPTRKLPEPGAFATPGCQPADRALSSKVPKSRVYSDAQLLSGERGESDMQIALPKIKEFRTDSVEGADSQIFKPEPGFRGKSVQKNGSTDAHVWNEKGNAHTQAGDYEAAIRAYSRAIEMDASFGQPYNNLAFVHLKLGRPEEALLYSLKSLELLNTDQEKAVSWNEVGLIYRGRKDYHNAMAAYQKADELDPDSIRRYETVEYLHTDPNPQNAQIWIELGDVFFKAGIYLEATNAYQQAAVMDPRSGICLSNLALSLVFQGKYQEAVHYYQKSISLFQQDEEKAVAWNRLGDVYRKLDDYDNAISAYQTAIKLTNEPVNLVTRTRFSLLSNCRVYQ